ncbi:3-hydroxy-3-methylglutaryl-coenzyme A reductase 1 [Hibiscus syriacus]|uniref:3-hydroxy-3-methylglutaryl coenzyme A reductase n=1 Tax=Hibiscus syriacus TaxID=106335 RepID=A0A6A3CQZ4_HIBSY|nr:3-hydroxy-3-methylglutaryl-coenzyme A reductase 2-like [Hibiscus syriacus]KAE8729578.1 3-hydroxy-3-methylglutaryl-coenzyme A reductase 1 [Hibiscus syriacus]
MEASRPIAAKRVHAVRPTKRIPLGEDTTKASDALPLPLYLTNAVFFTFFFSVVYFLLSRWREKIRASIPLHLVTFSEIVAIFALVASLIYLLGFFGVGFVQSLILRPSGDVWNDEEEENGVLFRKEDARTVPCGQALDDSLPSLTPIAPVVTTHKLLDEKPVRVTTEEDTRKVSCGKALDCSLPSLPPRVPVVSTQKLLDEKPVVVRTEEDEEIITSVVAGTLPSYSLESKLGDCKRAAAIRREALQRLSGKSLSSLPLDGFDYESILGQCCEMPVGYVQIPVGIAGPLLLNEREFSVPMATTEGCLVASTNRGCKAIHLSGGATCIILKDGMTRAPVVRFSTAKRAAELKFYLEDPDNFDTLAVIFNRSSRFGRLQSIKCAIAGKNLYLRFTCSTGDAMGMNIVSKGVQNVLDFLQTDFPDMDVIGISGNFCSDKKPAAVNWIEGRGKSVVCEAIIKGDVVRKILKTSVESLVELNMLKNLTGSAMAGALGGFNAHASNIVTAIYIATGQDPAQNVESSHCITMMEAVNYGKDIHVSVTMPSIEVGTVGGGTQLASQSACLHLLGVKGASKEVVGANSRMLATIVAGAVLAGELSLMSALAAGQLVKSHMKYNRSSKDVSKLSS